VSQPNNRSATERSLPAPADKQVATVAMAAAKAPAPAPAPPAKPTEARSPAEIERDIEATRVRLASSIDELADRVSPKNVAKRNVDRAKLVVLDESGAPRTNRIAALGAAVAAIAGIVLWRRRG
jgi:hypothetical protein